MLNALRSLAGISIFAVVSSTATADSISINGSQLGFSVAESLSSVSYTQELISSGTLPNGYATGSYYARAEFGDLGLSYAGAAYSASPQDQSGVGGEIRVESDDIVHLSNVTAADTLKLNLILDGGVTLTGSPYAGGSGISSVGYDLQGSGGVTYYSDVASCVNVFPCSSGTAVDTTITLPLSVVGATVVLQQLLIDQFECSATSVYPCEVTGDFAHSARIGGATVVDSNGNIVPGVTITSDSGYDYTQPLSDTAASTPEPPSFGLVLTGLPALFLLISRRTLPRNLQA